MGKGEGGGKVPGMGLGSGWIRATQEVWGEPWQFGAWEVEKHHPPSSWLLSAPLAGGRTLLFECRGPGFKAGGSGLLVPGM